MEVLEALKCLAPAVGDGRLVWQHAYCFFDGPTLRVCDGRLWAGATIDERTPAFVNYERLRTAMDREGAQFLPDEESGGVVRCGRSRVKLKGADFSAFPPEPATEPRWVVAPPPDFRPTLEVLSKFCGKADNHIWQMGVHFMEDFAFAASPFALCVKGGAFFPSPITVPPWAARFILMQEEAPNVVADSEFYLKMLWSHRLSLTSALLVEDPAENIITFARNVLDGEALTAAVPENMRDAIERAKALGARQVRIGNGKIDHVTEHMEFEDEIDYQCEPKIWGVDSLLDALTLAERIDLSGSPGKWEGNGYRGVFSGLSD